MKFVGAAIWSITKCTTKLQRSCKEVIISGRRFLAAILCGKRPRNSMGHSCCAVNCTNRGRRGMMIRFYRIPKCILHQGNETEQISKRRYAVWLVRINRKDWLPCEHHKICSDHFISGEIIHILFLVLIKKYRKAQFTI